MQNIFRYLLTFLMFISLPAFAGGKLVDIAKKNQGKTLAIVSLSAHRSGNSIEGWNTIVTTELMTARMNQMLSSAEAIFATDWELINARTFIKKPEYQNLAEERGDAALPEVDGYTMPLFSKNKKQLTKAGIDKDVAQSLAAATGTDFLMIIFSEWTVTAGRLVPTSKPIAKNVVSIYDTSGRQVYTGSYKEMAPVNLGGMRSVVSNSGIYDVSGQQVYNKSFDQAGISTQTMGSTSSVLISDKTLDHWVTAYQTGLIALFNKGRKTK